MECAVFTSVTILTLHIAFTSARTISTWGSDSATDIAKVRTHFSHTLATWHGGVTSESIITTLTIVAHIASGTGSASDVTESGHFTGRAERVGCQWTWAGLAGI